jgi:hypothetical protein
MSRRSQVCSDHCFAWTQRKQRCRAFRVGADADLDRIPSFHSHGMLKAFSKLHTRCGVTPAPGSRSRSCSLERLERDGHQRGPFETHIERYRSFAFVRLVLIPCSYCLLPFSQQLALVKLGTYM